MRPLSRVSEHSWTRLYAIEALKEQGGRCRYCYEPLNRGTVTGEHVIPRCEGGPTNFANVKASCRPCNQLKGALPDLDYRALIKAPPANHPQRFHILMANCRLRIFTRAMQAERNVRRAAR